MSHHGAQDCSDELADDKSLQILTPALGRTSLRARGAGARTEKVGCVSPVAVVVTGRGRSSSVVVVVVVVVVVSVVVVVVVVVVSVVVSVVVVFVGASTEKIRSLQR